MNKKLSVIIPAFNEEVYIAKTIMAILKWSNQPDIIVVNDGSADNTYNVLRTFETMPNIYIIDSKENHGKGHALSLGLMVAKGEIILFLDADLGESAVNAEQLLKPILDDNADMSIAVFPKSNKKAGFGLVKGMAKKGIFYLTGYNTSAPLSGQRAFKREVLKQVELINGFGIEVGLTIDVLRKGYRIEEIEIPLIHRESGRDLKGFIHRGREFNAVLKALLLKWREGVL